MAKEKGIDNLLRNHAAYWPDEEAMEEGNPQRILERGEARNLPPLLIVQGTSDDNLPPDMALPQERFSTAENRSRSRSAVGPTAPGHHGPFPPVPHIPDPCYTDPV